MVCTTTGVWRIRAAARPSMPALELCVCTMWGRKRLSRASSRPSARQSSTGLSSRRISCARSTCTPRSVARRINSPSGPSAGPVSRRTSYKGMACRPSTVKSVFSCAPPKIMRVMMWATLILAGGWGIRLVLHFHEAEPLGRGGGAGCWSAGRGQNLRELVGVDLVVARSNEGADDRADHVV